MSTMLAQKILATDVDPSNSRSFFLPAEVVAIDNIRTVRECPAVDTFPPSCSVNLSFGFFFDGTNNNLEANYPKHSHSNVARLYLAFPGNDGPLKWSTAKTLYPHYFRTYIPGVGTKFDQVGDSGEGKVKRDGLAFAKLGQNRIVWALVDAINNVHKYYLDTTLVDDAEFLKDFNRLDLPSFEVTKSRSNNRDFDNLTISFTKSLRKLHAKLSVFLPVGEGKQKNKGVVEHIYYSIFGFSRGAAEARVFANWFFWLCKLDAELTKRPGVTLGSIPVTFDFMGLFDTVASVGLASSAPLPGAHGHYGWADADHSLKLPEIVPGQVNLSLHNQIK